MTERNQFTELQEKWLQALERGEIEQIQMDLAHWDKREQKCIKMCCLGVATHAVNADHEALRTNGWDRYDWAAKHDLELDELAGYGDSECTAPPDVVDALHLNNSEGKFRFLLTHDGHDSLINLNDKANYSFAEIAAFIREKPWFVFTNFDLPKQAEATS